MTAGFWWLIALTACKGDPTVTAPPTAVGLLGDHALNPFPVGALHFRDDAFSLDSADFGIDEGKTALPFERLAWRDGFSVGQTSVVTLPGIREDTLPHWSDPQPGAGGVRLFDRADEVWLPTFAELDAHPEAEPGTLLIRPLVALTPGHDIAVVLTTDVVDRPAAFQELLDGPGDARAELAAESSDLLVALDAAGLPSADVALAWSFPVGDGTQPLRSAWSQLTPATEITIDEVREAGQGAVPRTFRAAEGTFRTTDFLVDDLRLSIDGDTGAVTSTGTTDAVLYVHIPESVADAPAGTVPILVFGHGIFANPGLYLDEPDDPSSVVRLADDGGYIVVATTWRGLTTSDAAGALSAATDFGKIHHLTDKLVQAQANIRSLVDGIAQGDILDDPVFQGASGQKLPSDRIVYYGISLGSIEGSVMLANDPPLDAAALHVGGSTWSTMLERSSNWNQFEGFLEDNHTSALDRQRLYAASQLWWDAVDPLSYAADLRDADFLYQISIGDEQVANLTSYAFARSAGLPLFEPAVDPVHGLDSAGPSPSRALVQFDPETALPPDANRPAPVTRAHDMPRNYDGTLAQIRAYLDGGPIQDTCSGSPCTTSNPGTP